MKEKRKEFLKEMQPIETRTGTMMKVEACQKSVRKDFEFIKEKLQDLIAFYDDNEIEQDIKEDLIDLYSDIINI